MHTHLGSSQNGVFVRIIRMVFRWYLKNSWYWILVLIDHMTNPLGILEQVEGEERSGPVLVQQVIRRMEKKESYILVN